MLSVIALIAFVSGAIYTEAWNTDQRGGNHNLTGMNWISAKVLNGTSIIGSSITVDNVTGALNWTYLWNYPVACPTGSYLTQLDDAVTCTSVSNIPNSVNIIGDLNVSGNINASSLEVSKTTSPIITINHQTITSFGYLSFNEGATLQGTLMGIGSNFVTVNRRNFIEIQSRIDGAGISFWTNNGSDVERMRIDSTGKVGIGTTSLTHKLNVVGNQNLTGNLTLGEKITFAFGEIIDNIVDGWITITGSLDVSGNVTAQNVFLPAMIFSHTMNNISVGTGGVWYNVTFDNEADPIKKNINHTYNDVTNHTFTILSNGTYEILYTMSFSDASASPTGHINTRVVRNDLEINGSLLEVDTSKQNADVIISHSSIIVELTAADLIKFQFTADDTTIDLFSHATYGDHRDSAVISIKRMF